MVPSDHPETYEIDKFFALALDMFCIAGLDGYFKRINPAFTRVLGHSEEDLLSRPWVEFIHPDDRTETVAERDRLEEGALTLAFENRYICKDGTYKVLSWTAYPDPKSGLIFAVARDITEMRKLQDELWKPLGVDLLTGLANRRTFSVALGIEWKRYSRLKAPLALAIVGLDDFRSYNAKHGREGGDDCLKAVGDILTHYTRRPGDVAARFAGERFSLLFGGGFEPKKTAAVGEAIREEIERLKVKHTNGGPDGRTTASLGLAAIVPEPSSSPQVLVRAAESALAVAKRDGRNRIHEHAPV